MAYLPAKCYLQYFLSVVNSNCLVTMSLTSILADDNQTWLQKFQLLKITSWKYKLTFGFNGNHSNIKTVLKIDTYRSFLFVKSSPKPLKREKLLATKPRCHVKDWTLTSYVCRRRITIRTLRHEHDTVTVRMSSATEKKEHGAARSTDGLLLFGCSNLLAVSTQPLSSIFALSAPQSAVPPRPPPSLVLKTDEERSSVFLFLSPTEKLA